MQGAGAIAFASEINAAAQPDSLSKAKRKPMGIGLSTGLQIPRFVSLKYARVNARVGPSREHNVTWIYLQEGLPVEVIQEFDNWRRIRDWEGTQSWVFHTLLSGHRTALIAPWDLSSQIGLHASPEKESRLLARLSSRVLVQLKSCDGNWCFASLRANSGEKISGWVQQEYLFGAYPKERF